MNTALTTVLQDTSSTRIMGIINVTPDSFFDGGRYDSPGAAATHAARLASDGAHILDVGGESSRPGAAPVSPDEELRRVMPAIEAAVATGLPVSIDTYRAETARHALAAGAVMVNDITGLRGDDDMAGVVAEFNAFCVIMHMKGNPQTMQHNPEYKDVVGDIEAFFVERIACAHERGITGERIWLDPGFGFGKTAQQNLELLRRLDEFKKLGFPLLIGTSNKSTIGAVLNASPLERAYGTAATVALAISKGVHCVRVHDVKAMAQVARMSDAALRGRIIGNA
ncbi:MAG TPA: dihydropteroate synthase [Candidatus Hydrogenedentes bacterium]|nr:dihydropteroate synthase [Candidatus Hydrogenedentota bacterium]